MHPVLEGLWQHGGLAVLSSQSGRSGVLAAFSITHALALLAPLVCTTPHPRATVCSPDPVQVPSRPPASPTAWNAAACGSTAFIASWHADAKCRGCHEGARWAGDRWLRGSIHEFIHAGPLQGPGSKVSIRTVTCRVIVSRFTIHAKRKAIVARGCGVFDSHRHTRSVHNPQSHYSPSRVQRCICKTDYSCTSSRIPQ